MKCYLINTTCQSEILQGISFENKSSKCFIPINIFFFYFLVDHIVLWMFVSDVIDSLFEKYITDLQKGGFKFYNKILNSLQGDFN